MALKPSLTKTMSLSNDTKIIKINQDIFYLPSTMKPFSCDIVFIKDKKNDCTWIFDVGFGSASADVINLWPSACLEEEQWPSQKNIVISHFHPDHIANLPMVKFDNLYVSAYTKKYTLKGSVISAPQDFGSLQILPMPSSHAKGCLALIFGDYAFLGDGAFCKYKGSHHIYNQQLLKEMIAFLEALPCKYFALDHEQNFIQNRQSVIAIYKDIYSRRKSDEPFINVDDYFIS